MIAYGDVYKPYPYVFVSGRKPSGIGHSGPGGILWPLWPPTDSNLGKNGQLSIIIDQSLIIDSALSVGDQVTWSTSIRLNAGNSSIFSELSQIAQVITVDSAGELFDPGSESNIGDPTSVDVYVVFARNSETVGLLTLPDALIEDTVPFSVMMQTAGSLSRYVDYSDHTESVLFDNLMYKVTIGPLGTIASGEWIHSTLSSNFIVTGIGDTLRLQTPVIAISHPEKTGYLSVYFGGLLCSTSSTRSFYVQSSGCSTVMGPCWYPHTTFFPLVELFRDELPIIKDWLELDGSDLTYADETPGYGIIRRDAGNKPAEYLVAYQGELLFAPLKSWTRGYQSFQPDAIDSRVIQDSCIYPVVGRLNTDQMDAFTTSWTNATRPFKG